MKIQNPRRWTRSQLAAIAGAPRQIPVVVAAALFGESVSRTRARVRSGEMYSPLGDEIISSFELILEERTGTDNPPLMLRNGVLVPRPSFSRRDLGRLGLEDPLNRNDVRRLTGQTDEEVRVDILARRLRAFRTSRGWTIEADQLLANEDADA